MKLTDEQMNRVLKAHEEGRLVRGGFYPGCRDRLSNENGCLIQIAYKVTLVSEAREYNSEAIRQACSFDNSDYSRFWTTQHLKEWIEAL